MGTCSLFNVRQISCTKAVRTSGSSSGTKLPILTKTKQLTNRMSILIDYLLPQHLITRSDWELEAERCCRISSSTSSMSRREIRPDRRTS